MNPDAAVYLGTVAAIGFVLKCTILLTVEIRNRVTQAFVILCLFFILQNAAEFLGYFTYLKSSTLGEFFIHVYMMTLFYVFPSLLLFTLALTGSPWFTRARMVLYGIASLLSLVYLSGQVVAGFQLIGWSVITTPGPAYWLAMSFVILCGLGAIAHLLYYYRSGRNAEIRQNARVTLLAFTPILAVALAVLGLRLIGFNSSSAISMPVATLLFLYIMLLHANGNLFWLSTKFKSIVAIIKMDRTASVDEIIREIEKVRILEALRLTEGQQKSAAEILGVPPSTLNKRLTKYRIDAEQFKQDSILRQ